MTNITVEHAYNYGVTIQTARRLDADERAHYTAEAAAQMLISTGDRVTLDRITWADLPNRKPDGCFAGASNRAWFISEDERDDLLELNREREQAAREADRAAESERLRRIVSACEAQSDLPSREEARRRMREYNDIYNEGGEGYVPYMYNIDDYRDAMKALGALR